MIDACKTRKSEVGGRNTAHGPLATAHCRLVVIGIVLAVSASVLSSERRARAAERDAEFPQVIAVSRTFNNAPFEYRIESREEKTGFTIYRLTYPSPVVTPVPQNNTVPAEYYVPRGIRPDDPKRPAVVCMHILDGGFVLVRMMCSVLASHGIPAIMFKLPYYEERGLPEGPEALAADPKLFVGALSQGLEDVRRTVDVLASRPEVDPERIGIAGISLGGIVAATAAGVEPRFWKAMPILAGGDLNAIIHHARETRELSQLIKQLPPEARAEIEYAIDEVDPLRHAERLRDRAAPQRVLMVNAAEDEVIPRPCTEKLASALGIADRVIWLDGLGHYTAMAELPQVLQTTVEFFGEDLPSGLDVRAPAAPSRMPLEVLASLAQQVATFVVSEPEEGRCHFVDFTLSATPEGGKTIEARLRFIHGSGRRFKIECSLPVVGEAALGQGSYPWMVSGGKVVFKGVGEPADEPGDPLAFAEPEHFLKLRMAAGAAAGIAIAPHVLNQWLAVTDDAAADGPPTIHVARKGKNQGSVTLAMKDDGKTPQQATFDVGGVKGTLTFRGWQANTVAHDAMFDPPPGIPEQEVDRIELYRIFSAMFNFAMESTQCLAEGPEGTELVARDPAGHGLLCKSQGKTILIVAGTPEQMGAAHGTLLRQKARKLMERVLYLVGGADSIQSGIWFLDRMAEIEQRTLIHTPERFLVECDALAKAVGVSQRDGRYANLFPERFHCSGVAVRGRATADGSVLHARVLDYMRDIHLQDCAAVVVFMPDGRNTWMSLGYAGFIGTVTAMNEKGLAIGEMGGGGVGDWDGVPMSYLLRDVMERASTVEEGLEILRNSPRTCEYYYVLSDKSRAMAAVHADARQMIVLGPGRQHAQLPFVPDDTVLMSGPGRAQALSDRLQQHYGRIDVPTLIEIIKRPVAMSSNLHDAIFAPETLDMWFADAGRHTAACDEPYAHANLAELVRFYEDVMRSGPSGSQ